MDIMNTVVEITKIAVANSHELYLDDHRDVVAFMFAVKEGLEKMQSGVSMEDALNAMYPPCSAKSTEEV